MAWGGCLVQRVLVAARSPTELSREGTHPMPCHGSDEWYEACGMLGQQPAGGKTQSRRGEGGGKCSLGGGGKAQHGHSHSDTRSLKWDKLGTPNLEFRCLMS